MADARLYIDGDGDRQRYTRSPSGHAAPCRRRRGNPLAGSADRAWNRARPAFLRRQEPRLLDSAVDWVERLFLPAIPVGLRQLDGLDVAGPHVAADRHGIFADIADGV